MAKVSGENGAESGIYGIFNLINGKVYIGSSININKRLKQHCLKLNLKNHCNVFLQNAWNKYGQDCFKFLIIENLSKDKLREKEQYFLNLLKTYDREFGYNLNPYATGGNHIGYKHSETTRKYISLRQIGKKHSEETKRKIGIKSIGRCLGNRWNLGRKATEETRKKLSEIQKKRFANPYEREKSIMLGIKNREIYSRTQAMFSVVQTNKIRWYYSCGMTQQEIAKLFKCNRVTIGNVLNRKKLAYKEAI